MIFSGHNIDPYIPTNLLTFQHLKSEVAMTCS